MRIGSFVFVVYVAGLQGLLARLVAAVEFPKSADGRVGLVCVGMWSFWERFFFVFTGASTFSVRL